jgi:putative heme-binding domain-containing protein
MPLRLQIRVAVTLLLLTMGLLTAAPAVEPWADPSLKFTEGLIGWYDASVQNAARQAAGLEPWGEDAAVDTWRDGSGHRRDLTQSSEAARPTIRFDSGRAFVYFNGQDSWLGAEKYAPEADGVTMFIVAAPFANDGGYQAFASFNREGHNDYVTGVNLDQGPTSSRDFITLNAEGAGFSGIFNLKHGGTPFGPLARMALVSRVGPGGTSLYFDGVAAGRRDRRESKIGLERLTVGARYYNHGGPPEPTGFLRGEIAEVLIYDRALDESEIAAVDGYLKAKYAGLGPRPLPPDLLASRPVPRVENPPPVQVLMPGFAAYQLPVELYNVNNLRYRPDGKLLTLSFNGQLHLLSDSDGDGLEDHVEVFWDQPGIVNPIGMALTPPGYPHGQGALIAARGQVVLVVDTDGDDRGDKLIVVADGWQPIKQATDALGAAFAPDGSIYYGTGTFDFMNGYQLDAEGKAHYVAGTERGAIVHVSADFKTREPVCSGIRFPVALAFNREGDLFCTDQEGATWLPNGNPLDELLHIQPNRHYGFPPRHPKHLPDVIDEPSVYDYGPQHQSTCGLIFDTADQPGGKIFGPAWWEDDALVCGFSRGKLYRTSLVKAAAGYVASNEIIAAINKLTVDSALAPNGELAVSVHSGGPDWGNGPSGKGTLYKIRYVDEAAPQPVRAWVSMPQEVRVAFDRPLSDEAFARYRDAVIEAGAPVRGGDRFELFWPGYAVVEMQNRAPRRLVPVIGANLSGDRRSVLLATGPHREAVGYATLFGSKLPLETKSGAELPQYPAVELSYDLSGLAAQWQSADGKATWQSWLPHADMTAARGLLKATVEQAQLESVLGQPGTLTLKTQLDLSHMLRPLVQPGSKLDMEFPPEVVTVNFESAHPLVIKTATGALRSEPSDGKHKISWTVTEPAKAWHPLEIVATTGAGLDTLAISWHTAEDSRTRAMAPRRMLLPWAQPAGQSSAPTSQTPPELAGGDWHRGRELFYSETAQCGKCHSVRGRGSWIGPDLSNLVHRDYASVLRDIETPNFAINPDHQAYHVVLDDGRVLTGMVQPSGETLKIGDTKGVVVEVPRASVEEMRPAQLSIMPEGLPRTIGPEGMRDLLTFLLLAEPGVLEPAPLEIPGAPPARSNAEVGQLLSQAKPVDRDELKPLTILLLSGPKDHGPGEHDYPAWQKRWSQLLGSAEKVNVLTAENWPSADQWQQADVVVMYSANPAWTPAHARDLDTFFQRGGGLVLLHYAVNGQRAPEELAQRIGLAWNHGGSKFRHGELLLDLRREKAHPITAGYSRLELIDESYWDLLGDTTKIDLLATADEAGKPRPLMWTYEPPGGRVFVSIPGHYSWTFDDPLFRLLVLRAIAWTSRQPIDRFNDQVLPGARLSD